MATCLNNLKNSLNISFKKSKCGKKKFPKKKSWILFIFSKTKRNIVIEIFFFTFIFFMLEKFQRKKTCWLSYIHSNDIFILFCWTWIFHKIVKFVDLNFMEVFLEFFFHKVVVFQEGKKDEFTRFRA